jgi:glycerol-3-phosphate dehydrogenase
MTLPLLGAGAREQLDRVEAPERLVRRFGTEAPLVLSNALDLGLSRDEALVPVSPTIPVTLAELVFGVTHEGAADVDDLLDRRTRVGLVPADRAVAEPLAVKALEIARTHR